MVFKTVQVLQLIKNPGLNQELRQLQTDIELEYYIEDYERLALARLNPFLTASPQFNPVQSAYGSAHSIEPALLKMLNDVYESVDTRMSTVIVALDI